MGWGTREATRGGRWLCRFTFPFEGEWRGKRYRQKQVSAIVAEAGDETFAITVLAYYF